MTGVEVFVDPSCPWAWITSRWVKEVAPHRDLDVRWRSYCLEIRDEYEVPATVPEHLREVAMAGRALSHRMLRIFESVRARKGEQAVDALYTEWGRRFFAGPPAPEAGLPSECLAACGLDTDLLEAAEDTVWDRTILDSMEVAYAFGGPKSQTPVIVVGTDPPHGFKGPVMASAPTGQAAVRFWDAVGVLGREGAFFEITRPRTQAPRPAGPG